MKKHGSRSVQMQSYVRRVNDQHYDENRAHRWQHIPETKLHDLRHQFAISALGGGADLSFVSKAMGHTKASFTLEKYAYATNGMLKETAKSIDRYADTIFQKTNAPDTKKPGAWLQKNR